MIYNDERETITVMMDYKGTKHIRPFHCVRCGKIVCELTGQATAVIPGLPSSDELESLDARVIARCGGVVYLGGQNRLKCTAKYLFT